MRTWSPKQPRHAPTRSCSKVSLNFREECKSDRSSIDASLASSGGPESCVTGPKQVRSDKALSSSPTTAGGLSLEVGRLGHAVQSFRNYHVNEILAVQKLKLLFQ